VLTALVLAVASHHSPRMARTVVAASRGRTRRGILQSRAAGSHVTTHRAQATTRRPSVRPRALAPARMLVRIGVWTRGDRARADTAACRERPGTGRFAASSQESRSDARGGARGRGFAIADVPSAEAPRSGDRTRHSPRTLAAGPAGSSTAAMCSRVRRCGAHRGWSSGCIVFLSSGSVLRSGRAREDRRRQGPSVVKRLGSAAAGSKAPERWLPRLSPLR
jgi:hypothetical protein